jgi:hypothetical protein
MKLLALQPFTIGSGKVNLVFNNNDLWLPEEAHKELLSYLKEEVKERHKDYELTVRYSNPVIDCSLPLTLSIGKVVDVNTEDNWVTFDIDEKFYDLIQSVDFLKYRLYATYKINTKSFPSTTEPEIYHIVLVGDGNYLIEIEEDQFGFLKVNP